MRRILWPAEGSEGDLRDRCSALAPAPQVPRERYPERYEEPVAHFDAYRALLDVIGWQDTKHPEPVQIDLAQHHRELLTALEARLEIERDYMAVSPHLKGAERQRRTATRYARAIEGFLRTVRAHVEQIGGR